MEDNVSKKIVVCDGFCEKALIYVQVVIEIVMKMFYNNIKLRLETQ